MKKVSELEYRRIDRDEIIAAVKEGAAKAEKAASGKELAEVREKCLSSVHTFQTMLSLSFVRFTLNTRDEFYAGEKDYYDELTPEVAAEIVKFQKAFLSNPHVEEAKKYIHPLIFKQYELSVKCSSDKAVPYRIKENKIVTEYTKLMSETTYDFRGEKLTLSALRKYFSDSDRSVRKEAYTALGTRLQSIGDKLDDIYDRLVKVRTETAKVLGFDNFAELGDCLLGRISYNRDMIRTFRENVKKDVVPRVAALKKELSKRLGITDFALYDNDTYFAHGNPAPVLSPEEMFEKGKEMYHDLGSETGKFFDMMLETDAFDVFPREGKWGGGYMDTFLDYRQPFILANFNGTSGDVDVLTHEAGHAFAAYTDFRLGHDLDLTLGMETAETHSMSMEFFACKYMDAFFGSRADDYRYVHLFDALDFIPYGTIVDYFQELVYTHPEMTPAERNALWLELEHEFRPWLNQDGIPYLDKGTRWQYQMHIFESPMYYIDYCLAQSVAIQFYLASLKDYDKAFGAYLGFVEKGGTEEFPALVRGAGLKVPFEDGALAGVARDAENLIKSMQK